MNRQYFNYLLRKDKNVNIVITLLLFILMPVMAVILVNPNEAYFSLDPYHTAFAIFLLVLTYIMPVVNFSYLHSKRAVDTYMQLPLTKGEVFITRFLYTGAQIFVPWAVNFLLAHLVFVFHGYADLISIAHLIFVLGMGFLFTFALVSFNTFISQKCNNLIDSMIVVLMYHLLCGAVISGVYLFISTNLFSVNVEYDFLNFLSPDYDIVSVMTITGALNCDKVVAAISSREFLFAMAMGVVSFMLALHDIKNRVSERAEMNTDSYFCYPLIIVSFSFIILLQYNIFYSAYSIMLIVTFVFYMIGIFIYKRDVRFRVKYVLLFLVMVLLSNLFTMVFFRTHGFNIDQDLPDNFGYYHVDLIEDNMFIDGYEGDYRNDDFMEFMEVIYDENRMEYYDSYSLGDDIFSDRTGKHINLVFRNHPGDYSTAYTRQVFIDLSVNDSQWNELQERLGELK